MSHQVKALALAVLVTLTTGALVAVNASATAGGHFASNRAKTTMEGVQQNPDELEFVLTGTPGIVCEETTHHGVVNGLTFTSFTLSPTYPKCKTTGSGSHDVTIAPNGCFYEFTVRPEPATKHNTVHLRCPTAKMTVKDLVTNCTISIGAQTHQGVLYKPIQYRGTKSLTLEFTIKTLSYTVHQGLCIFMGTNQTAGELKGSLILKAWEDGKAGEEDGGANITAT